MLVSRLFKNKRITIGVSGCIAAYKSCYLTRFLVTNEAEVRVMMTAGARQFITPLTLETLSNHPVYSDMFPADRFAATHHIELADWSEAALIVPATANILAKAAHGISDDFVSTVLSALHCPLVFAPAMNTHMWSHPATRRNISTLREDGFLICEPEAGFLAEGYSGMGRLARPEYLEQYAYRAIHPAPHSLHGKKVLITAGATREFLDPARMLSNPSTGKMGFALALEAWAREAEVLLIHGKGEQVVPAGVRSVSITSAQEMFSAVEREFSWCDLFIGAAAVADYAPGTTLPGKMKKTDGDLVLNLQRTPDIIHSMAARKRASQQVVGFAVETDQPEENALRKLKDKKLDLVVLNNPLQEGAAFAGDTNAVVLLGPNLRREIPLSSKLDVAREILDELEGH